ncbi:MAG TPA: hypothetical protein HA283_05195 [Nanoarchaeota archaeon]|nr:hypothetical protein [Nanoarchaeota archaeon]HIH63665.1 hypothetical protein [Nanoarchaeota archaeon]HIJ10080.1 hypothetical protein [Nanoarchaeota archaeon]
MDNKTSGKITKEEIKNILIDHYNKTYGGAKIDRELIVLTPDKNKNSDCYFFALAGTPPKGYGIFITEKRVLCLYDLSGKRFKEYYLDKGISDL